MSIAIISDSTAYLTEEMLNKFDIHTIPLNVIFGEDVYRENEELSNEMFYNKMRTVNTLPTTSQPSIGDYVKLLEQLKEQGITDVISIHLSSGISGTYQSSITAGQMVDGVNVHSFDTEISCMPQGFYAIRASEMKDTHTVEEIMNELQLMKKDTTAYFLVDDLKNLQKGGRLTGAQALIGSLLQVKPILHFEDAKIVPYDKVRTKKKAMKAIEELMIEFAGDASETTASIIHANDEETAKEWLDSLKDKFPNTTFVLSEFGPVIGTHLGEKALGFGLVKRRLSL